MALSAAENEGVATQTRPAARDGQPLFSMRAPAESIDALQDVLSAGRKTTLAQLKSWFGDKWTDWKRPLLATLQLRHLIELATGEKPLLPLKWTESDSVLMYWQNFQRLL